MSTPEAGELFRAAMARIEEEARLYSAVVAELHRLGHELAAPIDLAADDAVDRLRSVSAATVEDLRRIVDLLESAAAAGDQKAATVARKLRRIAGRLDELTSPETC
jgi:hypothetical protein